MLADVEAEHIRRAVAEYDELGRDPFLERYGYQRSRTYLLVVDGRRYDSKAVVGVAHRFIGPEASLLRASEFSGGADTVARLLRLRGFEVEEAVASDSGWTSEERILALDLYFKIGVQSSNHPNVVALSEELNSRAFHPEAGIRPDFRNPNGVNLKLANFASLDPTYGGRGMASISIGDEQTWDQFAGDRDLLTEAAAALRRGDAVPEQELVGPARARVESHPVEAQHTDSYEVVRESAVLARRSEAKLVLDFADWLSSQGRHVSSHWYRVVAPPLRADLVDETERRIWEAKSSPARSSVRMAIGQLLDYRRLDDDGYAIGLLVSTPPSADLLDLLKSVEAAVARRTGESTEPFAVHS